VIYNFADTFTAFCWFTKPQSKKIKGFLLGFHKNVRFPQCVHMDLIYVNIFKLEFLIFIKNTVIVVLVLKLMREESREAPYNVIITTARRAGG